MKKAYIGFSIGVAAAAVLLIIFLASGLWRFFFYPRTDANPVSRIIMPREANTFSDLSQTGRLSRDDSLITRVPMEDEEVVIAVLNRESAVSLAEEQFVVYTNAADAAREIYLTYISYNEVTRSYSRMWNTLTAATRPDTISIYSLDLIGDRNNCIIVTGMNSRNEHTITIFRQGRYQLDNQPFERIAELQIDGSIIIRETPRSLAYQQGMAVGHSFDIAAYGHDSSSHNILDQVEIIYSFDLLSGQYEQTSISRIPGLQIEQQRLRELLSGVPGVFENFINDLWYYVSPQGTIDSRQYIYFDPSAKEIIFFGDEAQQVFRWNNSIPTRYGLSIRSQNISISTLLRSIEIELESLDGIRLRVTEDVRLRMDAITTWDGSYRRAGAVRIQETASHIRPAIEASYNSSWGRIQFNRSGEYVINSGSTTANTRQGRYVFFTVDNQELLELRQDERTSDNRMVYRVENLSGTLILSRVRLSTTGIQDLLEPPVTLTPVESQL